MSLKELGEYVQKCRKLQSLTQVQLAQKISMDEAYIRRLEAGKQVGSVDSLISVALALGENPGHLVNILADTVFSAQERNLINTILLPPSLWGKVEPIKQISDYTQYLAAQQPEAILEDTRYLETVGNTLRSLSGAYLKAYKVHQIESIMKTYAPITMLEAADLVNRVIAKAKEITSELLSLDQLPAELEKALTQNPNPEITKFIESTELPDYSKQEVRKSFFNLPKVSGNVAELFAFRLKARINFIKANNFQTALDFDWLEMGFIPNLINGHILYEQAISILDMLKEEIFRNITPANFEKFKWPEALSDLAEEYLKNAAYENGL